MVVFTCGHCGESVNKPKVEKHYATKCRGRAPNLSCMDCFKDFFGNEHESHTKCISEAQRYGGAGFVDSVKKGEQKQSTWVELVQAALDESLNAPPAARRILEEVSKHSNTPRKKPKFVNFVRNVCGHRTMPNDIDAAWDVLTVQLERLKSQQAQKPQNQQNGQAKSADTMIIDGEIVAADTNIEEEPVKTKKKEKKRKIEATIDSTQEQQQNHENQPNGRAQSADTTTTNRDDMDADTKTEDEPVKTKKKEKKRKSENVDSTQEQHQKSENQQNGQAKPADTTTINREIMELDNKTEDKPVKAEKKEKRKLKANADSTLEVTQNGHATNGENTEAEAIVRKKRRKEEKKESKQETALDDRPAVSGESEGKKKKKRKNGEIASTEEADVNTKNQAPVNETPVELDTTSEDKFDWNTVLTRLVQDAGGHLSIAKLKKRLLKEYTVMGKSPEKAERKFEKRLKTVTELRVEDNVVFAT